MDSKTEPASEAKERIEELELENERLKQAYKYIHASRNSVDEELNEANKEITRLKAELERERELRKEAFDIFKGLISQRGFRGGFPHTTTFIEALIQKAKN